MPDSQLDADNKPFANLVRALLAILLTASLPILLYLGPHSGSTDILQAYQDALAAVVAFYFGATSTPA
jgi:hypothetical protein